MLQQKQIGLVLLPGCHDADLVQIQTIFSFHPRNRTLFLGQELGAVQCQSGLSLHVDCLFEQAQTLDLLVMVGAEPQALQSRSVQQALQLLIPAAKQVLAVGQGVLALAQLGLLHQTRVAAQPDIQSQLCPLVAAIEQGAGFLQHGKFVTATTCTGAIEAALTIQGQLRGQWLAKLTELTLEYAPTPRFDSSELCQQAALNQLPPLTVGVLMSNNMYLPDSIGALSVFNALPNCQVIAVAAQTGEIPCLLGPTAIANTDFDHCPQLDVLIVGATMPWQLSNPAVIQFVQQQAKQAKALIGVCAGSLLLGAAGLLQGKQATSNFQMRSLLAAVDAVVVEQDLVTDDKFYTAGPAIGAYESALLVCAKLYGNSVAAYLEQQFLHYRPNPPFAVGHPDNASADLLLAAKAWVLPLNPIYRHFARKGFRQQAVINGQHGAEKSSKTR